MTEPSPVRGSPRTPALGLARDPATVPGHRYRLGVMGVTFDPIHHGHLVAASEVASRFGLDEVVFVPTGQPWQKSHQKVSSAEDRYLMTVIATASNPRFSVSRVDIDRGGPTYTVDTLRDLHDERGDDIDLHFITGADALAQILTWRDAEEVVAMDVAVTGIIDNFGEASLSFGEPQLHNALELSDSAGWTVRSFNGEHLGSDSKTIVTSTR